MSSSRAVGFIGTGDAIILEYHCHPTERYLIKEWLNGVQRSHYLLVNMKEFDCFSMLINAIRMGFGEVPRTHPLEQMQKIFRNQSFIDMYISTS